MGLNSIRPAMFPQPSLEQPHGKDIRSTWVGEARDSETAANESTVELTWTELKFSCDGEGERILRSMQNPCRLRGKQEQSYKAVYAVPLLIPFGCSLVTSSLLNPKENPKYVVSWSTCPTVEAAKRHA